MIDWWSSLLLEKQIFYAIGLASISILLIQIFLTFLGIDLGKLQYEAQRQQASGKESDETTEKRRPPSKSNG